MVEEKNIAVQVILSIITCGLYGIVWFIEITNDVAKVSDEKNLTGAKAFLFTLITCGIYSFFWDYKMGKLMYKVGEKEGIEISDNSVVYVIFGLFGLGIVDWCMIQNDLNKIARKNKGTTVVNDDNNGGAINMQ